MTIINPARVVQNFIALAVIGWVFFMIYSKMDKASVRDTMERIKGLFRKKEE